MTQNFKNPDAKIIYEYVGHTAPDDMIMIDIGARTGKWLSPYVRTFPNAKFFCFEGLEDHYSKLSQRFRKNTNVVATHAVLSESDNEEVIFFKDLKRAGWSGMKKHQYMEQYEEINSVTQTLDSFNIKNAYFIKIDVEGAELLVLKGAKNTLKDIKIIYFECNEVHFKEYNYTANDLYDFLNQYFDICTLDLEPLTRDQFSYMTKDERRYDPNGYQGNFVGIRR